MPEIPIRLITLYFPLLFLFGCAPDLNSDGQNMSAVDYIYTQPQPTNSPITVSTLQNENIVETEIVDIVKDILDNKYGGIDSMLLLRNGSLVLEEYFNGFNRDKKHDLRSATKSITGLLTGIAIDKGYLASVNMPIYDFFTRYSTFDFWSNLKSDITVQHLLTMSSGWECNDHSKDSIGNEDRMYRSTDWVKFILDLPMVNEPGNVFSYCTGGAGVLGDVVSLASDRGFDDFADQYLFGPLDITQYHFRYTPTNRVHAGGQMHMTPMGMLKIGLLFLNNGNWFGEQIVSSQWIAASQTPYFPWYSNLWWIWSGTSAPINTDVAIYYASGNGGQRIYVVPQYNLVAAFTGHEYNNSKGQISLGILVNRIIPAMN